jgi:hypothetical protein
MADHAQIDIIADRRAWVYNTFAFLGRDFTAATLKLQVRVTGDTTGTPLVALVPASDGDEGVTLLYAGTDTVANHIAASRVGTDIYRLTNPSTGIEYAAGDSLLLSQIRVTVEAVTVTALPFPAERGGDNVLAYDLLGYDGTVVVLPTVLMAGAFIVRAGVTIP